MDPCTNTIAYSLVGVYMYANMSFHRLQEVMACNCRYMYDISHTSYYVFVLHSVQLNSPLIYVPLLKIETFHTHVFQTLVDSVRLSFN